MTKRAPLDVMCIGEPMLEFRQNPDGTKAVGFGGDVMNVAVAVTRLGGFSGLATRIGGDQAGQALLTFLEGEGVDLENVCVDAQGSTGSYHITQTATDHQFGYDRAGSAASRWGDPEAAKLAVKDASIIHLSGITQAISTTCMQGADHVMARAQAAGTLISYDPNYRPQLWSIAQAQAGLEKVLEHRPILLPGLDDARLLTGLEAPEDIVRLFKAKGALLVALTAGADGVYLSDGQNGVTRVPGIHANRVDASGAGDCFDGAFLLRLAQGDSPTAAATFANKAAALSVTKQGAAQSIPRLADVQEPD